MHIFTLVTDVEKVVESLRKQQGEFALALLYNETLDAGRGWNLIVAAPWADKMGDADATRVIAHALHDGLALENQPTISRVTVLKTSDPFVKDMIGLYPVTPGARVPVQQLTAGQLTEGSGFILYSQKVA